MATPNLTDTQLHVLQSLLSRKRGASGPYPGSGWTWGTHTNTVRILVALAKKGLVDEEYANPIDRAYGPKVATFKINALGIEWLRLYTCRHPECEERPIDGHTTCARHYSAGRSTQQRR